MKIEGDPLNTEEKQEKAVFIRDSVTNELATNETPKSSKSKPCLKTCAFLRLLSVCVSVCALAPMCQCILVCLRAGRCRCEGESGSIQDAVTTSERRDMRFNLQILAFGNEDNGT